MLRIVLLACAALAVPCVAYYTCDHGMAVSCFQAVDGAISNTVSQAKNGLTGCQVARHLWFDFFQCMRYASCWSTVLRDCDQFVATAYLYLGGTFGQPLQVGNVTCDMPTDCEHLFGAPDDTGVWVINASSALASGLGCMLVVGLHAAAMVM